MKNPKCGQCSECPHVFSEMDLLKEYNDKVWGHPCFDTSMKGNKRKPGSTMRCESYRTPYPLEKEAR